MEDKQRTTQLQTGNDSHERWIRIPTRGRCPYTGLTRSYFYELINAGKIKSACLKRPGTVRGARLIWLPSVLAYIEKHIEHVA